jgi:hypothetical protein
VASPRSKSAALIALATVAAMVVWLWVRTTPGPLGQQAGGSTRIGAPVDIGGRVAVGVFSPTNAGASTLVIDSLIPDVVPAGLSVLGYGTIPWGMGSVGALRSFPPSGFDLQPLKGRLVPPGQGVAIVIGFAANQAGTFTIPGFTLRYHSGRHHYAAHYNQAIVVCAPYNGAPCST